MIRFDSDYTEGAHPLILKNLTETNYEQTPGYGEDEHCARAAQLIKISCGINRSDADIHFLVGGTQTNAILIAAALKPYEGVVSASTGHINVHETGAVEAEGHKILTIPSDDGKINAEQIRELYFAHKDNPSREHTVKPGLVYLSQPTENGTIYTKNELEAISGVCRENGLYLYVDGARLGYALTSPKNDITLHDLAGLCDAFYIGGTKVGALFGEALVIINPALRTDFRYNIKQRGGMLAKSRLLGIQFETLFTGGLYTSISESAVRYAMKIRSVLKAIGIPLRYDSYTNQQFPVFDNSVLHELEKKYVFSDWGRADSNHTVVRICTSWATNNRAVAELLNDLNKIK